MFSLSSKKNRAKARNAEDDRDPLLTYDLKVKILKNALYILVGFIVSCIGVLCAKIALITWRYLWNLL